jgi:GMP synthase (glutamine-hydrolysing)
MRSYIDQAVAEIRAQVGKERVILGLSAGWTRAWPPRSCTKPSVTSSSASSLTMDCSAPAKLRWSRRSSVNFRIKLQYENAATLFLKRLKGVIDPEKKRKIIGRTFIEVFQAATKRAGRAKFLAQGTLYPDVIESVPIAGNPAALIKSHHNVGGLPKNMKFTLIEPLKCLFKDEVRQLGVELGLPKEIVWRQPFPGPGLAVRILGEVTRQRCEILRNADRIVVDEMKKRTEYTRSGRASPSCSPCAAWA